MTTQDFVKGLDLTGLATVGAADINQSIDNTTPSAGRGIVLYSVDTALGVADTPDVSTIPRYARCLWLRIPHTSATDRTPALYAYNPTSYSWNTVLDITGIDLDNLSADALTSGLIPTLRFGDNTIPLVALQRDDTVVLDGIQKSQVTGDNAILVNDVRTISGPIINCKAFGAIGDGTVHTLAEWVAAGYYANLAAIQADYPFVSALTETIDYVAIQAALNYAWKLIAAKHKLQSSGVDLTNTVHCNVPTVYLPAGEYLTTKSLIIPPHCNFKGDGMEMSIIGYTPGAVDTKWSFMSLGSYMPGAGLYCALVIPSEVLNTTTNITTVLSRHAGVLYDTPIVAGDRVTATSAEISDLRIVPSGASTCGIYAPILDAYTFRRLHIIQDGQDSSTTRNCFGIIGSYNGGGGYWILSRIENCDFESLSAAVYIDKGQAGFIFQNNKVNACSYGLRFGAVSKFSISNNVFNSDIDQKFGVLHLWIPGVGGVISGNIFANTSRAIYAGGSAINISNNVFSIESVLIDPAAAIADGYAIKIAPRSVIGPSAMDHNEDASASNLGFTICNNSFSYLTAKPAFYPIYIANTALTNSVYGVAYGNTYGGLLEVNRDSIIKQDIFASIKVIDDQLYRSTSSPTFFPDYGGQLFSKRVFTTPGDPATVVARDEVYAGLDGFVEITNTDIEQDTTYYVYSEGGAGSITYDTVSYAAGTTFLGLSGKPNFTATGDGKVFKHFKNYWIPINYQKRIPINTLATAAASKTLSVSEAATIPELEGVVVVNFDNSDANKVVELPAPSAALAGRELTLIVSRPSIAGAKYVRIQIVGEIEYLVPKLTYHVGTKLVYPLYANPTYPQVMKYIYITSSGVGVQTDQVAVRFCSKFLCDGTYWYQI